MIDPKATVTYSQYNEDVTLLALLHNVKNGFYVDVGANYPTIDSVTKLFYDRGWHGINIEPIKKLHSKLEKERSRDINLQCGAGDVTGASILREYTSISGHSTFDTKQQQGHPRSLEFIEYEVPIRRLEDIFAEHTPPEIHFMKIDVEGFERQVVLGNDWAKYRPLVICIEANHRTDDWRPLLTEHKYKLFVVDGLNEYYIAEESWKITNGFAERAVKIDYHALKQHQHESWQQDSEDLTKLHALVKNYHGRITNLERVASLSLKEQPYHKRLKVSLYGLTLDWLNYKKGKRT